ncbi:MAG: Gfo/Idh/MocA family protein [Agriterribacter sp.]
MTNKKLGVALVGLGEYATQQILPALQQTKLCYAAALVSGSKDKKRKWAQELSIGGQNLYDYSTFDSIANNNEVNIVYITLPNSMHAEFAIRAAQAGKHVICEKPMALNISQCKEMIQAVQNNGVRFSMGYRLHFDPFNKEMMRLGQRQVFGKVKRMELRNSMIAEAGQWRLDRQRAGGGPLMNNGVYCVQAAIYITGALPVAVEAKFSAVTEPEKFKEVEEGIEWTMFFEDGTIAVCESSYSKEQNLMRAEAEKGWFELSPAYEYNGLKGRTSQGVMQYDTINQQAVQMDDFANCILTGNATVVPAGMGLRDMEIMAAIYESAASGQRIELQLSELASV